MSAENPAHRREIDGLRAIAVLAVVLYHFTIPGFDGGFVGVDIFFVLSGFLIGDILWREVTARGTISLKNFYARRIRRLAPAFCAMAVITFAAAYWLLLPYEFREFGKTLIASTVYLSNVQFYRQAGYFDGGAEDKILLHTWSLSVEEQFYIFLPLLLLMLAGNRTWLLRSLVLIFLISLGFNIAVTPLSHTATFYLFPFRAWELLAGVLLAVYRFYRKEGEQHAAWISWTGLALLGASIVFTQPGPAFPGVQAIFPVLGTVLILFNGRQDNLVNRALSMSPMVFIGLISYSLYLWHWPVLTLSRYYIDGPVTPTQTLGGLALAFALAYASWRFVEQPVRFGVKLGPTALYSGAAAASVVLLAIGGLAYVRDGLPDRFPPSVRAHIDASADFLQDWSRCYTPGSGPLAEIEICPLGPDGPPSFLVWGDSHVRAFAEGLALLAREQKRPGLLIWRAGCPPLFGIEKEESAATRQQDADCAAANRRIRQAIPQMKGIEKLLLIGRWSYYSEGRGVGIDASNTILVRRAPDAGYSETDQKSVFDRAIRTTIAELSESVGKIFVLRQVPEIPAYDSRVAARRLAHNHLTSDEAAKTLFTTSRAQVEARMAVSEAPFRDLSRQGKIDWLESWDQFCSADSCGAMHAGRALYFDNNHITNQTAISIRHIFGPLMDHGEFVKKSEARN
jgi:peptidoglycan/LPS O-acetylase OafA/YrhL